MCLFDYRITEEQIQVRFTEQKKLKAKKPQAVEHEYVKLGRKFYKMSHAKSFADAHDLLQN